MTVEETILLVNPLIKGSIKINNGILFFGRMYQSWERKIFEKEMNDKCVNCIFNVTEKKHNIDLFDEVWFPINDFKVPKDKNEFIKTINLILLKLKNNENIFLHCYGGKGRTSVVLSCLLIMYGFSNKKALNKVEELLGGPENNEQINFILDFK